MFNIFSSHLNVFSSVCYGRDFKYGNEIFAIPCDEVVIFIGLY